MTDEINHNGKFEDLAAGYVLNILNPGEQAEFERMLNSATQDQLEFYQKLKSAASQLAFSVDRVEPSESVKQQLLQVIQEDLEDSGKGQPAEPHKQSSDSFDKGAFAVAASFVLLIISLSLIFYSLNMRSQLKSKENQIEEQQTRITELKQEIEQKNELLAILESREVGMVIMKGMEASPSGYGKIIWDPEKQQALLQVSNLPPVPADKEYQLWIIKNNRSVSCGMFAVHDPKKDAFFKIELMGSTSQPMEAFAVTLEPKGGMPQPTGDMYLMGNMEK